MTATTAQWLRDMGSAWIAAADRLDTQTARRRGETMGVNVWPTGENLARAASLGVGWVRISDECHWHTDGDSPYDWGPYDRAVGLAHAYGLRVLQACQGMPAKWAKGGTAGHVAPRDCPSMLRWADWTAECAARGADAVEIGNEWNHPEFWGPQPDPAASGVLTAFAADAIKKRAPAVPVITGGLAPGSGPLAPPAFLAAQLAAAPTMLDHVDGVGHHPYAFPYDPAVEATWNAVRQTADLPAGRPVWATEYGSTCGPAADPKAMSEDDQVLHTLRYWQTFDDLADAGVTWGPQFWYALTDGSDRKSWISWMGLWRLDGTERPVAELVRHRAAELVP